MRKTFIAFLTIIACSVSAQKIDRKVVVTRNTISSLHFG